MFVSKRVARRYRDMLLPESQWVLSYASPWPSRSYTQHHRHRHHRRDADADNNSSTMISFIIAVVVYVFTVYVQLPSSVQDLITQLSVVSSIGYACVLFVRLYRMSPALLLVPIAIALILCWGLMRQGTSTNGAASVSISAVAPSEPAPDDLRDPQYWDEQQQQQQQQHHHPQRVSDQPPQSSSHGNSLGANNSDAAPEAAAAAVASRAPSSRHDSQVLDEEEEGVVNWDAYRRSSDPDEVSSLSYVPVLDAFESDDDGSESFRSLSSVDFVP